MEEKKLTRSAENKKLCGVCAGIAKYFNLDPTVVRVIWVLLSMAYGSGVLIYIVCALLIPEEK